MRLERRELEIQTGKNGGDVDDSDSPIDMDVSYDCELNLSTEFEPTSLKEVSSHDEWKEAMQKEYDALINNGTWKLVDPPLGTKPVGCKFSMSESNPLTTPMEQNLKLTSIEGKEFEDATKYRQLVGSLNYLTTTRPDISFVVRILSKFMQMPCEGHWSATKSILKYLKGTQDFGIKDTQVGDLSLIGYSDSGFDGDKETGVSTSGYIMSLGSGAVSWRSLKKSVPVDSTIEEKYVAPAEATKEIVWLRKILEYLQVKKVQSTPLMIDNTSGINFAKNPKFHDQTKHINTKYHLIRHHVEAKTIHLCHCSTNEKITDIFTKALGREKLERFRTMRGLTNIPSD
eukprot:PITA_28748